MSSAEKKKIKFSAKLTSISSDDISHKGKIQKEQNQIKGRLAKVRYSLKYSHLV